MDSILKKEYEEKIREGREFIDNILKNKYLNGKEKTYEDMVERQLSSIEKMDLSFLQNDYIDKLRNLLINKRGTGAGSICAGLGIDNINQSLSNCYVLMPKNDSIESIYNLRRDMALINKSRGGCGFDISCLRNKNAPVSNAAKTSSGSVSFLPGFSETGREIGQNGRRSACICSIDIRHPDVMDFIWCKSKPEEIFENDTFTGRYPVIDQLNISVKLTNKFFECVLKNKNWEFIFPDFEKNKELYDNEWDGDYDKWIEKKYPIKKHGEINARELLKQIAESAWISGDPGVLYIDNAIEYEPSSKIEGLKPATTNPCGEIALASYQNCLLLSLILHRYVSNPFTSDAYFDTDQFLDDVETLIIFGDLIIDINSDLHPLQKQRDIDKYSRKIGLGFTGLSDLIAMLNMRYGSSDSIEYIEELLMKKAIKEIETSLYLAKIRGHAPCFKYKKDREKLLKNKYIKRLFEGLVDTKRKQLEKEILKYGLRNSGWSTCAPNGSTSITAGGNCTSGIEPLIAIEYNRTVRDEGTSRIFHFPLLLNSGPEILNMSKQEIKDKYNYIEAHELHWKDRIEMQSVIQKYTSSSISSTINLPEDVTVDEIYNIYLEGWMAGLKGVTIFRNNCKRSVLTIDEEKVENGYNIRKLSNAIENHLNEIKEELYKPKSAERHVMSYKGEKTYINVSFEEKSGHPIEIFASLPVGVGNRHRRCPKCNYESNEYDQSLFNEHNTNWNAICRLISLCLRTGINTNRIIKVLEKSNPTLTSLPGVILRLLRILKTPDKKLIENIENNKAEGELCPECGKRTLIREQGCQRCISCSYNKCG